MERKEEYMLSTLSFYSLLSEDSPLLYSTRRLLESECNSSDIHPLAHVHVLHVILR